MEIQYNKWSIKLLNVPDKNENKRKKMGCVESKNVFHKFLFESFNMNACVNNENCYHLYSLLQAQNRINQESTFNFKTTPQSYRPVHLMLADLEPLKELLDLNLHFRNFAHVSRI